MPVFNRRNAALGWAAWLLGKRMLKRKANAAARAVDSETRHPKRKLFALLVAAGVGAAAFFRRQASDKD